MADDGKREKIASARKKLKQFQKKDRPVNNPKKTRYTDTIRKHNIVIEDCVNSIDIAPASPNQLADNSVDTSVDISFANLTKTTASTESLQQLSRQLNGLINESVTAIENNDVSSDVSDLEKRNQELASLLEHHDQTNQQLNSQIHQVRQHACKLESQLEQERESFSDRQKKEVATLKEQLQVHIQTIGLLVAEKTELQSQLTQVQKLAEQRFEEIEEFTGHLKASRQRVADLERNLSSTSNSNQEFENSRKDRVKEIDRLKIELYKSQKSHDEVKQQTSELQEKFSFKVSDCRNLEQKVKDLSKELEMAEQYAQQLSNQSESGKESIQVMAQLQTEKESLIIHVKQLTEAFQKVNSERDQLVEHYQTSIDQLQHHSQTLTQQLTTLAEEKEKLIGRQCELEGYASELQSKLDDVDSRQSSPENSVGAEIVAEFEKTRQDFESLSQRHDAQIHDNSQLSRLLEEREKRLLELEAAVSRLEGGDKEQLLENIQSDKTALSRALSQNKELKIQLAELQNGFVKMSNDNMDILTQLQTKEHNHAEIATRLAQQEDELMKLHDQLSQKDVALGEMKEKSQLVSKEMYQEDQIQDRLRHYEAQAQIVDTLQRELHASQDMVEALVTQNSELRAMLIRSMESKPQTDDGSTENDGENRKNEVMNSLSATIQQMDTEKNQLLQSLKGQRELSDKLCVKVADMEEELLRKSSYLGDKINRAEFEQMRSAMDMIQDKYSKVMRDKADLSDRADQLEHIVLQLQGETDTIGEYISLYHHQRALLQQREVQKNDYISQLAQDREELQAKLGELQSLVMQLLGEKHMLHSYHEETRRPAHSPDVSIESHVLNTKAMVNGDIQNVQNDWPDYTSSDTDSESDVETIVGGPEKPSVPHRTISSKAPHSVIKNNTPLGDRNDSVEGDHTAHKILSLLSEIEHSSLTEKTLTDYHCLSCKYCKGKVQVV